MTDIEFEVLDELYFVQSFAGLQQETALGDAELREVLEKMYHKGWLRCMPSQAGDPLPEEAGFPAEYANYYFLASKAGLLAHNSR